MALGAQESGAIIDCRQAIYRQNALRPSRA
jgi:hypothetical protein